MAIPTDAADVDELFIKFHTEIVSGKITFAKMVYGANAVDTRNTFWGLNWCSLWWVSKDADVLVSDITGYPGTLPVVYNFNITKLPELDRPYIDQFWDADLKSIENSVFTTVLNPRQREYILEVRPDLVDKIIVNTKCAHENLLPLADEADLPFVNNNAKLIFWPFRISDAAYKWAAFLEAFKAQGLNEEYTIAVTDPNESLKDPLPLFVIRTKPTKEQYYKILSLRPIVVMLDDIDTVLHPGTIEFFHYQCPVITFNAALLGNKNSISSLDQLSAALEKIDKQLHNLAKLGYNSNLTNFVYKKDEVDAFYNERFISGKS